MYEKFLPCVQSSLTSNPTPIPVYQRPMELYQEPMSKRKSHGVDFNNLILLTKNSMKTRRGYSRNASQQSSLLLDTKQPILKSNQNIVSWFDKDYARKTKEVMTVNALVSELRSFEEKYEYGKTAANWKRIESIAQQSENVRKKGSGNDIKLNDKRTKRPLYRDVVANSSSSHGIVLENVFERRYVRTLYF